MKKLIVTNGKNDLILQKSRTLVGIKPKTKKMSAKEVGIKAEILSHLGGFKVVTLDQKKESINKKLDKMRAKKR